MLISALKPPIDGLGLPGIFTAVTIPDTRCIIDWIRSKKVKRSVVVGGGFIGQEMAENLKRLGIEVTIVEMLSQQIERLRETGVTVLLAEQNVKMAMRLSDRAYVIDDGIIRYQGTIDELQANKEVCKKYLLV